METYSNSMTISSMKTKLKIGQVTVHCTRHFTLTPPALVPAVDHADAATGGANLLEDTANSITKVIYSFCKDTLFQ
jgi:hypothetical protein